MSLFVRRFGSPGELATYVNDNTIPQANIQRIIALDSGWYLYWWA